MPAREMLEAAEVGAAIAAELGETVLIGGVEKLSHGDGYAYP